MWDPLESGVDLCKAIITGYLYNNTYEIISDKDPFYYQRANEYELSYFLNPNDILKEIL